MAVSAVVLEATAADHQSEYHALLSPDTLQVTLWFEAYVTRRSVDLVDYH